MRGRIPVIAVAFAIAPGLLSAALAQENSYPNHAIRLMVSSGVGGNPDLLGRLLAKRMTEDFGQTVVVENVQGAGTALVALTEAKATPDGYTLMLGDTGNMAIIPALNPGIGYDPVKDFTPITALAAVPTILVAKPDFPPQTLSDFIALAKKEPGKITYGSGGVGSIHHLTMAIFADQTGIDVLHVPYRAGTAMVNGLLTGEIQVAWSGIPNVLPGISSGQLRGYCISVLERSPSAPQIPTCDELGIKGFDPAAVLGLYGPAGTPPQVVTRLQTEAAKIMREPAMVERMNQLGMIMRENGTANYVEFRKQDAERYANIVHKLDLHTN